MSAVRLVVAGRRGDDRRRAVRALGECGTRYACREAASLAETLDACRPGDVDAVLVHIDLPDAGIFQALGALPRDAAGRPVVPAIVLCAGLEPAVARRLLRAGAADALGDEAVTAAGLARAVENALERHALSGPSADDDADRARLVLAVADDGIWEWDVASNRIHWSDQWYRMLGYAPGEFPATFAEFESRLHPDDRERVLAANADHNARATPLFEQEFRLRCGDGSYRWILSRGKTVYGPDGRMQRVVGFHVDIEARKRAEEVLERRSLGLELVNAAAAALLASREPRAVIADLFQAVADFVDADVFFHYRHVPEASPPLELALAGGVDEPTREAFAGLEIGSAICGWTAAQRRGAYFPDFQSSPPPQGAALRELGLRVYVCHPLIAGDRLIGTLSFGSRRRDAFDADELTLIETIARHVAAVLDREAREAALASSESRYRGLADAVPVPVWACDADGRAVDFNHRWTEFTGLDLAASRGFGWLAAVHPDDREPTQHLWQAAVRSGTRFDAEYRLRRADGSYRWALAQAVPVLDEDGRVERWFGATTDVHDQRLAAAALGDSEERLRLALQAAGLGTWEWDLEAGTVSGSPECCPILGFAAEEFDGTPAAVGARLHGSDLAALRALRSGSFPEGASFRNEVRVRARDGGWRWVLVHGRAIAGPDGRQRRLVGIVGDVTARKLAEEERERLLAAERAARTEADRAGRLKDEFLATISHELRTPLNSILGWARLLLRPAVQKEMYDEGIRVIERNAKIQAQLISDLLDINRIVSGKLLLELDRVDANDAAAAALETVQPAANDKGLSIATAFARGLPPVRGDFARLQQAIWNLLANAIKFTPPGGKIELATRRVDGCAEVEVRDSGQGIAPEFLPHVFDRFRQADGSTTRTHGGLGLGLAIVKQLVEMHRGEVHAASDGVGRGAAFRIRVPLIDAETAGVVAAGRPRADAAAPADALEGLEVLLVDDQADALEFMRRLLVEHGVAVTTAARAEEALDRLRGGCLPQVLVSDIGMPGMDGYELVRAVRGELGLGPERLPAVAVTAFAREDDRRQVEAAGYQVHLPKPLQPDRLLAALAALGGRDRSPVRRAAPG